MIRQLRQTSIQTAKNIMSELKLVSKDLKQIKRDANSIIQNHLIYLEHKKQISLDILNSSSSFVV